MRPLLFFLIALLCCASVWAQGAPPDASLPWKVIAPAGLKLRAQPNIQAKVLSTAPFGEKVKLMSDKSFRFDTVGYAPLYYDHTDQIEKVAIVGHWWKVRCQGQEGYMFSAYLGVDAGSVASGDEALNQEAVLLFPGYDCFSNFFYHPNWHWYGAFASGQGLIFKKVQPAFYNFYHTDEEVLAGDFITVDDTQPGLRFIVGSKNPLPVQQIRTDFLSKRGNGYLFDDDGRPNDALLKKYHLEIYRKDPLHFWDDQQLVLKNKGIRQIISPSSSTDGPWNLYWSGDLDGDGQQDYIIQFGDKDARTQLYLSKSAAKNQLVRPVAVYYSGYCC